MSRIGFLYAFLLASCAFASERAAPGGEVPAAFRDVRAHVAGLVERGEVPSVAVAVLKGDQVVWAEGFGLANRRTAAKATPDTIYRLASVSKPVTATGLMILVDRGRVDLDAPANRYLPGAKLSARVGASDAITVRRLANHTAGLPLHYNFFYDGRSPASIDESIRRYGFAATEPGAAWEYSNLGFGILGFITETASGSPWRTFMDGELYDPLGMARTSDRIRPGHEAEAAVPYTREVAGRFVPVGDYEFDHPGASAVWSSANDLMRFARMHLWGGELDGVRVLSERATKAMQEPTGRRGEGSAMGVSWAITTERGHRCLSHTGGMPGASTALRIFPDDDSALVVLINCDTDGVNRSLARSLARRLTRALFPEGGTQDEGMDDAGPPQSTDRDVSSSWAGAWTGKLAHPDGDLPLKLTLEPPRSARVSWDGHRPVECSDVAFDGHLHAQLDGRLLARPDYHGVARVDFKLSLKGDRLTGVATAIGPEYYALSHWVELTRVPSTEIAEGRPNYDLLIKGGRVVDGCGTPWYVADVAIRDGRIAAVGRLGDAKAGRVVDARGLAIAPGFVDMMGQTAAPFLRNARAGDNLLTQGITTINAGEGESDAPLVGEDAKRAGWSTTAEFFAKLEAAGMPMNMVQTVGHTQVRKAVIGEVDRRATAEELERMKALVREGMEAGAVGLSTSLIYPPAVYAPVDEIVELARVAGEYGGRYFTHMRNEGDRLLEAVDEAIAIGERAGTPVHIFHLKAAGQANWPKMGQAIARIKAARAAGHQVGADVYPYLNNGLDLSSFIHPAHSAEGRAGLLRRLDDPQTRAAIRREMETQDGWENWYRHVGRDWENVVVGGMTTEPYKAHNGRPLAAIARDLGKDPWDVFFGATKAGAFALPLSMSESNKIEAMRQEFVSFCTDAGPAGSSASTHPRAFGSFPRILSHYVRDLGVLSLEQAVARMTSVAAAELGLYDRGRLAPGLTADIVVFDPERIRDRATLGEPALPSEGVRFVIVNGRLVVDDGRPTDARPGRILKGPGRRIVGAPGDTPTKPRGSDGE
jgi:N-acyl-D-aspartate/D-glutamate deacylase/CubicO group peptidase (beta-lactamase class C family)